MCAIMEYGGASMGTIQILEWQIIQRWRQGIIKIESEFKYMGSLQLERCHPREAQTDALLFAG